MYATILLVDFVSLKGSLAKQGKCFSFHFESSFRFCDNEFLTFQISKYHDVIKCSSMKHKTRFTEKFGKYSLVTKVGQFM